MSPRPSAALTNLGPNDIARIREAVEIYQAARQRPLPRDSEVRKKLKRARKLTTELRRILESLDLGLQLIVGKIGVVQDLRCRIGDAILAIPDDKGGRQGDRSLPALVFRLAKLFKDATGETPTHTTSTLHTPEDDDPPRDRYTSDFDRFVFDVCEEYELEIGARTIAENIGRACRVMKNVHHDPD